MLWRVFVQIWSLLVLISCARSDEKDIEQGDTEHRLTEVAIPIAPKVNAPPRPVITPSPDFETEHTVYRAVGSYRTKFSLLAACKYSCPPQDGTGIPLAKKATAFGWDFDGYTLSKGKGRTKGQGWYDVFECVYSLPSLSSHEHTCSYYKDDGTHTLGYLGDNCPAEAPACPPSTPSAIPSPANSAPPAPNRTNTSETPQSDDSNPSPKLHSSEANDTPSTMSPHFSSSQLDGAVLIDSVNGIYNYTESEDVTPQWVAAGRNLLWLKEHPPAELN